MSASGGEGRTWRVLRRGSRRDAVAVTRFVNLDGLSVALKTYV